MSKVSDMLASLAAADGLDFKPKGDIGFLCSGSEFAVVPISGLEHLSGHDANIRELVNSRYQNAKIKLRLNE